MLKYKLKCMNDVTIPKNFVTLIIIYSMRFTQR